MTETMERESSLKKTGPLSVTSYMAKKVEKFRYEI
jgi:hypothetical protein